MSVTDLPDAVPGTLTVETHDRLPASDVHAWDELVDQSPLPTPFLRSWWIEALSGPRTRVLLVREGGRLVGGLALERDQLLGITRWRVVGSGKLCPDHLDLLARPDRTGAVGAALHEELTRPASWLLDLEGVRAHSMIAGAWRRAGHRVQERVVERSPFLPLPPTYDAYLASRSKNLRARLRKAARRADRDGLTVQRVDRGRTDWALDRFEELNRARGDRGELLREMPRIRRWVTRGVAAGEVRLHVAERDGRVGVVSIVLCVAGVSRNYQTVRSLEREFDHAAGLTHLSVIADAYAQGHHEFDFLRGADRYKYSFTGDDRPVLGVRAAGGLGLPWRWVLAVAAVVGGGVRGRVERRKKSAPDGSNPIPAST